MGHQSGVSSCWLPLRASSPIAGLQNGADRALTRLLRHVHARMPHPFGPIEVWLDRSGDGLNARVSLPPGLTGIFVWKGRNEPIQGTTELKF